MVFRNGAMYKEVAPTRMPTPGRVPLQLTGPISGRWLKYMRCITYQLSGSSQDLTLPIETLLIDFRRSLGNHKASERSYSGIGEVLENDCYKLVIQSSGAQLFPVAGERS